jgi:GT2 family glycosyltransferase
MDETQGLLPRVTALVVSRNDETALRHCLEHLEASVARDRLEILVVDDGSRDATPDVLSAFPSVISLRMPKQLGWTRAVNIGLRTAKGTSVLLMQPEVFVRPETITRLADTLEHDEEIGAVCPYIPITYNFPNPEDLAVTWRSGVLPHPKDVTPRSGAVATDYPRHAPILVRRELLRAMNYLDQRFGNFWADLEMCARIRSSGKKILVLTDVDVDRRELTQPVLDVLEWTDSAHGIATWISLHYGFAGSVKFRLGAALHALGRGRLSAFTGILSGTKIDGNQ